jgi:hypothetical protein
MGKYNICKGCRSNLSYFPCLLQVIKISNNCPYINCLVKPLCKIQCLSFTELTESIPSSAVKYSGRFTLKPKQYITYDDLLAITRRRIKK